MSIFGFKKKHVDTSEIEKEILKIKSDLLTMDTKDKHLYRSANALNLRVLNIESMVTTIKSKPDRKIISIYAGIDGPLQRYQEFNFNDGGPYYVMNFPGHIISISLISIRNKTIDVSAIIAINTTHQQGYGIELHGDTHSYVTFDTPFKVEAGDIIGFVSMSGNSTCINTLVSLIIEIDI